MDHNNAKIGRYIRKVVTLENFRSTPFLRPPSRRESGDRLFFLPFQKCSSEDLRGNPFGRPPPFPLLPFLIRKQNYSPVRSGSLFFPEWQSGLVIVCARFPSLDVRGVAMVCQFGGFPKTLSSGPIVRMVAAGETRSMASIRYLCQVRVRSRV